MIRVFAVILGLAAFVWGVLLALPLVAGCLYQCLDIEWLNGVFQVKMNPSNVMTNSFNLALLSAALGGFTLWFATGRKPMGADGKAATSRRIVILLGKFLLLSAFCFTLYALLSPSLTQILSREPIPTDFWSQLVRYSSFFAVLVGGLCLSVSVCLGITSVIFWPEPEG